MANEVGMFIQKGYKNVLDYKEKKIDVCRFFITIYNVCINAVLIVWERAAWAVAKVVYFPYSHVIHLHIKPQ